MSLNPSVRLVLGVLCLFAMLAAAAGGQPLLVAGLTVLACSALWRLNDTWRYVLVGALLLALIVVAVVYPVLRTPLNLVGGMALLAGLMLLLTSRRRATREVARSQNVIRALEKGSAELADAKDTRSVIKAGVQTLDQLRVSTRSVSSLMRWLNRSR